MFSFLGAHLPFGEKIFGDPNGNILNSTYISLKSQNEVQAATSLLKLMKSKYCYDDLSFLGFDVLNLLSSEDFAVKIIGYRFASFFFNPYLSYIDLFPTIIQATLQFPTLLSSTLNALSKFINPFVYDTVKAQLKTLAISSTDVARKFSLCSIFNVYRQDNSIIEDFLSLLKNTLFQPSTKYLALGMLCEIAQDNPQRVQSFTSTLVTEVPLSTPHYFTKLSRLFITLLPYDDTLQGELIKALPHYISHHTELISLIDLATLLSHFSGDCSLYSQIGSEINKIIASDEDPNHRILCLNALSALTPKFRVDTGLISIVSQSPNKYISSSALQIKYQLIPDKVSVLNEILANIKETKSSSTAKHLLRYIPRKGEKFIETLFQLYELGIKGIAKHLAKAIRDITDEKTQLLLCKTTVDTLIDTPDDEFGYALATAVSDWSQRATDIELLLPSTISRKSSESQSVLIECAFHLFFRLHFLLPKGLINRLELLAQSPLRQVRQRAAEYLFIIEQIIVVSKQNNKK
ncbi:hypothetical protein GPJ56_009309 [Histomonas meleagridis]|uniref:uncharacterized protein n=1 Tax=Histomonas meleagridis TaxID=135588 RepID=UPI00355A4B93|nr:hypothetical protein GPJ56_009309 [Histomonas meleagridis]KAH0797722.1 hypothetical protein GO595_009351 [Histomonas meleagridis]